MRDEHNLPSAHRRMKQLKPLMQSSQARRLNKFVYRFRLARALKEVSAPDIGRKTVMGYTAGIRLLLAYSAFEDIRILRDSIKTIRNPRGEHTKIIDEELAKQLRKNSNLQHLLLQDGEVKNPSLKRHIESFFAGTNSDVMCIATALRNSFVHGTFTAGGVGLDSKIKIKHIDTLSHAVLELADGICTRCVETLEGELEIAKQ